MKLRKAASVRRIGEKWLRWIGDAMPCQSANAHQVPCTMLAGMQPASVDFLNRMERKAMGVNGLWLNWCKRPQFAGELQDVLANRTDCGGCQRPQFAGELQDKHTHRIVTHRCKRPQFAGELQGVTGQDLPVSATSVCRVVTGPFCRRRGGVSDRSLQGSYRIDEMRSWCKRPQFAGELQDFDDFDLIELRCQRPQFAGELQAVPPVGPWCRGCKRPQFAGELQEGTGTRFGEERCKRPKFAGELQDRRNAKLV